MKIRFYIFTCLLVAISLGAILTPFNTATATITEDITTNYKNLFLGRQGHPDEGAGIYTAETGGEPIAFRIGVIFSTVLMLVGVVFLIFTVYSGIQWMLAGGNEETIKKARNRIIRATIGLVIVIGAWVITSFVLKAAFGSSARLPMTESIQLQRL